MSTSLCVKLYHGVWIRGEDGHWTFQRKPSDMDYSVLVKPDETLEDLQTLIRGRYRLNPEKPLSMAYHPPEWLLEPEGTRTPPTALTSSEDVAEMMSLRTWFSDLKLCVTSGAEEVAYYQFLNNTTFKIHGATFVFTGTFNSFSIIILN